MLSPDEDAMARLDGWYWRNGLQRIFHKTGLARFTGTYDIFRFIYERSLVDNVYRSILERILALGAFSHYERAICIEKRMNVDNIVKNNLDVSVDLIAQKVVAKHVAKKLLA